MSDSESAAVAPAERSQPRYIAIAEALAKQIQTGDYAPLEKLPSELELARVYGVNRHTVARALGLLQTKGLVRRVPGHGASVSAERLTYRVAREMSASNSIARMGLRSSQRTIALARSPASDAVAVGLGIALGASVLTLRRLRVAGQVPFAVLEKHYSLDRFPELHERLDAGPGSVKALLLRHYGVEVRRARSRVEIAPADAQLSSEIGILHGSPVLQVESVDICQRGEPVEVGCAWFRADRARLEFEFDSQ